MDIAGKTVVVTGAASGLGEATARGFVDAGARVAGFDLGRIATSSVEGFEVDVTSEASVTAALDQLERVDVLVNCAGIASAARVVGRDGAHDLALFQKTIDINLVGSFNVARLAAQRMAANEGPERGVIINTASIAAFDGQKGQAAYAASKGGIAALSLPMARDMASLGIRVMAIAPGVFRTAMLESLGQEIMDGLAADVTCPKRLGDPTEFAALARFIVDCGYLNGEVIRLDGALRMP